jgi:hypothetical protein
MKASVAGRVRNTVLSRTKPLLPVFEAVINSFHAIDEAASKNGHAIHIRASRERTLDDSRPCRVRGLLRFGYGHRIHG